MCWSISTERKDRHNMKKTIENIIVLTLKVLFVTLVTTVSFVSLALFASL